MRTSFKYRPFPLVFVLACPRSPARSPPPQSSSPPSLSPSQKWHFLNREEKEDERKSEGRKEESNNFSSYFILLRTMSPFDRSSVRDGGTDPSFPMAHFIHAAAMARFSRVNRLDGPQNSGLKDIGFTKGQPKFREIEGFSGTVSCLLPLEHRLIEQEDKRQLLIPQRVVRFLK